MITNIKKKIMKGFRFMIWFVELQRKILLQLDINFQKQLHINQKLRIIA